MYLKSIEVHGFKSFANKTVFRFHNGITGIVGPNGSGKSNVADAVRWVLGEQSAKQLRGSNMQDVIFSGTETRKPLGYASVSITLDNSDHKLAVSYEEVTVTRRVYRSGESEYLLNGTQVRLRDINELFYDTGIGKEGYSIIGQGQVEKILNGKPEERRELFDEAAGIVKFKRRKNAAVKKLTDEQASLQRVTDILTELSRQVGPLERQAEKAKQYLAKRDELKEQEILLFAGEMDVISKDLAKVEEDLETASAPLEDTKASYEKTRQEYETLDAEMESMDASLQELRDQETQARMRIQKLDGRIELLKEQIKLSRANDDHMRSRMEEAENRRSALEKEKQELKETVRRITEESAGLQQKENDAKEGLSEIRRMTASLQAKAEEGRERLLTLLEERAGIQTRLQRQKTLREQTELRKSQLEQQLADRKSADELQQEQLDELQDEYDDLTASILELNEVSEKKSGDLELLQEELTGNNQRMEELQVRYHREASRLESLKNIAERYDGYGGSIRKVMEQRSANPGVLGVVADLIQTDAKYELAIETALGGSIQNIVTDTEETAKEMIRFLKQNRFGRATFLPLTGISSRGDGPSRQVLMEKGVIQSADHLVRYEKQYKDLVKYLLGRTVVVDEIDHAVALQRKYQHSLRIVTVEGELLSPGGSMTGGAFKNTSNLLGRRREIETLGRQVQDLENELGLCREQIDAVRADRNAARDEIVRLKEEMQQLYLKQNTVKLKMQELGERKQEASDFYDKIQKEADEADAMLSAILWEGKLEQERLQKSEETEQKEKQEAEETAARIRELQEKETLSQAEVSGLELSLEGLRQRRKFSDQSLEKASADLDSVNEDLLRFRGQMEGMSGDITSREKEIEDIHEEIGTLQQQVTEKTGAISKLSDERQIKNTRHKKILEQRETLSEQMSMLDRECFRLNAQKEKSEEKRDARINYMWEEYQLTASDARKLSAGNVPASLAAVRRQIAQVKGEIKALGNVNVNAIEEYKEISERHTFLSGQHADLVASEAALQKIIRELEQGMRTQFRTEFEKIRVEFNKSFQELFGGGKAELELTEEEDVLDAGIKIIAQPPGKKLVNMMQMSGGEKALTAIALLFAIQNLKPSPFCLLDEIEAALDENNVDRYARYLHKLTKNTQFIIITHRRGTMTAADRLYGVTMQEKGVSALVSVNLIEQELQE